LCIKYYTVYCCISVSMIINARWRRFQSGTASRWQSKTSDHKHYCDINSYTRWGKRRSPRKCGSISVQNVKSSSRRATRCIGIIDTNVIPCRVINAHIAAMSANGPTRSTIISGSCTRGRKSRWTSFTSAVGSAGVYIRIIIYRLHTIYYKISLAYTVINK
jgi:hypothetical protein